MFAWTKNIIKPTSLEPCCRIYLQYLYDNSFYIFTYCARAV